MRYKACRYHTLSRRMQDIIAEKLNRDYHSAWVDIRDDKIQELLVNDPEVLFSEAMSAEYISEMSEDSKTLFIDLKTTEYLRLSSILRKNISRFTYKKTLYDIVYDLAIKNEGAYLFHPDLFRQHFDVFWDEAKKLKEGAVHGESSCSAIELWYYLDMKEEPFIQKSYFHALGVDLTRSKKEYKRFPDDVTVKKSQRSFCLMMLRPEEIEEEDKEYIYEEFCDFLYGV